MNDFKDTILEGIKKGEIKAESKWRFLAHDYFFWTVTVVATILGSVAISSILHRVVVEQVSLAPHMRDLESVSIFVQTLPYIWILILVILGLAAWFNFKKTSKAYKYQPIVLLGIVFASLLFGILLFAGGVGSSVDKEVRDRVPVFERERLKREQIRNRFLENREQRQINDVRTKPLKPLINNQ